VGVRLTGIVAQRSKSAEGLLEVGTRVGILAQGGAGLA
jgi:hypothetical protein